MSIKGGKKLFLFCFHPEVIAPLVKTAARGPAMAKSRIVILVVSGFLSWVLSEYVVHRFVFHLDTFPIFRRNFLNSSHLAHHENPKAMNDLFANLRMSVPIATAYWLLAWEVLGTWLAASYLFMGLVV